jgi:hypothetical protein
MLNPIEWNNYVLSWGLGRWRRLDQWGNSGESEKIELVHRFCFRHNDYSVFYADF